MAVLTETLPEAGGVAIVTVEGTSEPSTSLSLASTLTVTGVPCWVAALSFVATGASLTAAIVTVTVAVLEKSEPSLARKLKLSVPLALGFGV